MCGTILSVEHICAICVWSRSRIIVCSFIYSSRYTIAATHDVAAIVIFMIISTVLFDVVYSYLPICCQGRTLLDWPDNPLRRIKYWSRWCNRLWTANKLEHFMYYLIDIYIYWEKVKLILLQYINIRISTISVYDHSSISCALHFVSCDMSP